MTALLGLTLLVDFRGSAAAVAEAVKAHPSRWQGDQSTVGTTTSSVRAFGVLCVVVGVVFIGGALRSS